MPLSSTPSRADIVNTFIAYILANSPLQDVSPTSTLYGLAAANASIQNTFYEALNLSAPGAIQQGLYDLFQFNGLPATPSQTDLLFSGTPGTFIPQGTQAGTAGGNSAPAVTFATLTSGTLNASGTATLPAQSIQVGSQTNVLAGSVVQLISPVLGISTVTNPTAAQGGADAETPSAQRIRFGQYLAALSSATQPALAYELGPNVQQVVSKIAVVPPFQLTAYSETGSTFTNLTSAIASPKGQPVAPFSTTPNIGDAFYIGNSTFFTKLYWDVAQAGSGWTLAWQYWSATTQSWATLTPTLDTTDTGMQSGMLIWDIPSDWGLTTVNGQSGFWIRLVNQSTTYTTLMTYYQIVPLTPPPGFVDIFVLPPAGTPGSVTLSTLQSVLPQQVAAGETGLLQLATTQTLPITVIITPTLYGQSILTTQLIVQTITTYFNSLEIGDPFSLAACSFQLLSLYQGNAVADVQFTSPTGDVYVPVNTLLVPGPIQVTFNAP